MLAAPNSAKVKPLLRTMYWDGVKRQPQPAVPGSLSEPLELAAYFNYLIGVLRLKAAVGTLSEQDLEEINRRLQA